MANKGSRKKQNQNQKQGAPDRTSTETKELESKYSAEKIIGMADEIVPTLDKETRREVYDAVQEIMDDDYEAPDEEDREKVSKAELIASISVSAIKADKKQRAKIGALLEKYAPKTSAAGGGGVPIMAPGCGGVVRYTGVYDVYGYTDPMTGETRWDAAENYWAALQLSNGHVTQASAWYYKGQRIGLATPDEIRYYSLGVGTKPPVRTKPEKD